MHPNFKDGNKDVITSTLGWRYPLNDNGEDDHLNHPGIEDFRNTPIISLAREICQNSLDARDPSTDSAVQVEFEVLHMPRSDFPGLEDFERRLDACLRYQPDSPRTCAFFENAKSIMGGSSIPVLKISDYKTTGCRGVSEKNSDWWKLTRTVGSSDKPDGLGSFGIGKFAPYANSELRTVFYSTLNTDGEKAFQGISRLISHEWEGSVTRGTGYYGVVAKNEPIIEPSSIPSFMRRREPGTTLAVAGFKPDPDWELKIISAVLENFFYAILAEKLIVRAGTSTVSNANLGHWVDKLATFKFHEGTSYVPYYYRTMVSSDSEEFVEQDFRGMGRISLRILTGRDFPKRVAIVRGSGMKIFDKAKFQTAMKFAGVFNASGDAINRYIKSMEPQQHDKLVAGRADDREEAEIFLRALYAWINEKVKMVAERQFGGEIDVDGVGKLLPDDAEDQLPADDEDELTEPVAPADSIPLRFKSREVHPKRIEVKASSAIPEDDEIPTDFPEDETDDEPAPLDKHEPKPNDSRPGGTEDGPGDALKPNDGQTNATIGQPVGLSKSRSFSTSRDNRQLQITFTSDTDGSGYLSLIAMGETIQSHIPMSSARLLGARGGGLGITADGRVGPIKFKSGVENQIEVELTRPCRFAMEVVLNADH